MFDEFFYRRRKNKGMLFAMIGMLVMGIALFAAGIYFTR